MAAQRCSPLVLAFIGLHVCCILSICGIIWLCWSGPLLWAVQVVVVCCYHVLGWIRLQSWHTQRTVRLRLHAGDSGGRSFTFIAGKSVSEVQAELQVVYWKLLVDESQRQGKRSGAAVQDATHQSQSVTITGVAEDRGAFYPIHMLCYSPSVLLASDLILCTDSGRLSIPMSLSAVAMSPSHGQDPASLKVMSFKSLVSGDEAVRRLYRRCFAEQVRDCGYCIVRLEPGELDSAMSSLMIAQKFFKRSSRYKRKHMSTRFGPENESRGYVAEPTREYFEVRKSSKERFHAGLPIDPTAFVSKEPLEHVWPSDEFRNYSMKAFHDLSSVATSCYTMLLEHAPGINVDECKALLDPPNMDGISSSCYRIHQYKLARRRARNSSRRRRPESMTPHCDLGLVTVALKGTATGLRVLDAGMCRVNGTGEDPQQASQPAYLPQGYDREEEFHCIPGWRSVEQCMEPTDLIVFGGLTLSFITSGYYRPLLHEGFHHPKIERLSLPFFLRAKPSAVLPTASATTDLPAGSNVHDLMCRVRRLRNTAKIPLEPFQSAYCVLQTLTTRYAPHLEYLISPGMKT